MREWGVSEIVSWETVCSKSRVELMEEVQAVSVMIESTHQWNAGDIQEGGISGEGSLSWRGSQTGSTSINNWNRVNAPYVLQLAAA